MLVVFLKIIIILKFKLQNAHDINTGDKKNISKNQPQLQDFVKRQEKYPLNHKKQLSFDDNVLEMLTRDGVSFRLVEGKGFKKLVKNLEPKLTIKSRSTYMRKISKFCSATVVPSIKKILHEVDLRCCHFSCDIWSSKRREGVLGVIAHYIDNEWRYKTKVVAFKRIKDRHTGENIKKEFFKCLTSMGLKEKWVNLFKQLLQPTT